MKAIVITKKGNRADLILAERPAPEAGAYEVLIKVKAAGLNRADIMIRKGEYGKSAENVELLGMEVAGIVEKCGRDVTRWKSGDAVCALLKNSGYAEYAVADHRHCLPVPSGLNFVEAAALPETVFTVWFNVFHTMKLKSGENILVHGGTSGIGITAIQMAKAFGARPYTTAGSGEKCAFAEKMGAIKCVNYKTTDFVEAYKGIGMDVILDYIAGDYTGKNLEILNRFGRLAIIAALHGVESTINVMDIMSKQLSITGSMLNPQPPEFKAELASEIEANVWPVIEAGKVKPFIFKTFPLKEAADAHMLMESGNYSGKIMLTL
jgi:NADPH2:quinone reductase